LAHCPSRSPPVISDNSDSLLLLSAKAQLSRGEQTADDQYILVGAIVDEFGLAILADDEQRRHFSLGNAGRELNIDLAATGLTMSQQKPNGLLSLGRWTAKA